MFVILFQGENLENEFFRPIIVSLSGNINKVDLSNKVIMEIRSYHIAYSVIDIV